MSRTVQFTQLLVAALLGALLASLLPASAAQRGDPFALGEVNKIDDRTDLKGDANGANLLIKNTGNSSALVAKSDRQAIKAKATDGPVGINVKADRVGVKIKVDDGQAPIKVNKTAGTATNLSADLLDGLDSTDIGLIASGASVDDAADTVGVTLAVDITAPVDGVLLLNGQMWVDFSVGGAGDFMQCAVVVQPGGEPFDPTGVVSGSVRAVEADSVGTCATSGHIAVSEGSYTVSLWVPQLNGNGLDDATLEVLFVPGEATLVEG